MRTAFLQKLRHPFARDERGATILEFGLIAPTLCVLLLGSLDYGHTLYLQAVLQGAVQKAARDGTLQNAAGSSETQRTAIDTAVRNQLKTLSKYATVTLTRRFYRSFTAAAAQTPETFTDSNHNGTCDAGEPFEDRNDNDVWDKDGADSVNHAGARDNVVYTVAVTYPRTFPVSKLFGGSATTTLSASTVLANQPFGAQQSYDGTGTGNCT